MQQSPPLLGASWFPGFSAVPSRPFRAAVRQEMPAPGPGQPTQTPTHDLGTGMPERRCGEISDVAPGAAWRLQPIRL